MKKKAYPPPTALAHEELETMLVELGKMFERYPEKEYLSEPYRYDVVWKKMKRWNPAKAFEIHDKGNLDSALAKLKHAHDIWNADLFLVIIKHKDKDRAKLLLSGSFHEIADVTTIIQPEEVKGIYEYKKQFLDLEKKLR